MAEIRFFKHFSPIQVSKGANLMQSLIRAGRPVARSCDGDAVCAKCWIRILEGSENLSEISDLERRLIEREAPSRDARLSCQVHVLGDICVDADYW